MELNANEIIKALECCQFRRIKKNCDECKYHRWIEPACRDLICQDALALITSQEQRIKELTAKVAKWEEECDLRGDMWCKLNEENKKLAEENERLSQSLANSKSILANSKADTVRQMQERLKAQKFTHKNFGELVYVEDIDQIAKEMLVGNNES